MQEIKENKIGRVLLLRWENELEGPGPTPQQIAATACCSGARFVLLDLTHAAYADSDGLRWLLLLRNELDAHAMGMRIASRPGGKVWRNLKLLEAELDVYETVALAWKAPYRNSETPGKQPSGISTRKRRVP